MNSLSSSLEDYLEVIFTLESQYAEARAKDIADAMGVQRASVTNALQKLAQFGLINYQPYASVTLTPEGFRVATRVAHRHKVLFDFLHTILGIRPEQAENTACKLEHSFDDESLDALIRFVRFVKTCPRTGADWLAAFARTCTERGSCNACADCIRECLEGQPAACPKECAGPDTSVSRS
ncbi:metal-dependent transcriptional regulator [Desulfovibrionales bacterium]